MITVDDILNSIGDLKPISPITADLVVVVSQPQTGLSEVARLISRDPSLASNLLKRVNSAYFGLKKKVDTLLSAVTVLGTRQTLKVFLTGALADLYVKQGFPGYSLATGELWKNAILSSEIAQNIALRTRHPSVNRIFTAALIRDIGKIVLNQFVFDQKDAIRQIVMSDHISYIEAEKMIMGIDHAQLGAMVARKWAFPEPIAFIIEHHHDVDLAADINGETAIVQAADAICSMIGVGTGNDGMQYKVSRTVAQKLMTETQVEEVISEILVVKNDLLEEFSEP